MTMTAMAASVIFLSTWLFRIPIGGGYVHLGDSAAYLFAVILGPEAVIAAAFGEMLSDIASGYAVYAPFTFLIKSLMVLPFVFAAGKGSEEMDLKKIIAAVSAGIINVSGYFLADLIVAGNYAAVDIISNSVQSFASAAAFVLLYAAFSRSGLFFRIRKKR